MKCVPTLLLALAAAGGAGASAVGEAQGAASNAAANPIRKVVNMLKAIQTKVEAEGEKEEGMFNKYMCYCKTSGGDLAKSVESAGIKIPELATSIEKGAAKKTQLDAELVQHRKDRDAAESAIQEAASIRTKEASEHATLKASMSSDVAALSKAVAAVEKGMAGSFLQTPAAGALRRVVQEASDDLLDMDNRQQLVVFLASAQSSEYSPQSGEITGILKQLGDSMAKELASAIATEEESIKANDEMTAAKNKEVAAHTEAIEVKSIRVGELAVSVAEMKNELSDTEASLVDDKKFLADMEKNCGTKAQEWDEIVKTRNEEKIALADTILLLQDDDALELFKKALPTPVESFVQVRVTTGTLRSRALAALRVAQRAMPGQPQLDLIALALHGKKGFDKVLVMIDEMVDVLKKEQEDDTSKKEYCAAEFDKSDDKKKALEKTISDEETSIASVEESILTLTAERKALTEGIAALDKAVAEATEQRKNENNELTELLAQNTGAQKLLGLAKNRLNKFYNPTLYVKPANDAFLAQVSVHAAPPPPPESPGAYKKKSGASGGVIAMLDTLVQDLTKEMTVAETEEKDAQADYETAMKDSADKRATDSKALSDKGAAKADAEAALQEHKDGKADASKELTSTLEIIQGLHAECDWLLQYFDTRKEARTSEIESLGNAKAVLSGADYSL